MTPRQAPFKKKNIIVTGGAGFIGSHLCDVLVQRHKVICLDNFSTGQEENIHHLLPNANFEFVRHDISEPINLEELKELKTFQVPFQGIQEIYHLATPTSPKDYIKMPVETLAANGQGTRFMLELAKKYGSKFILASSGAIYGQPTEATPLPENYWGYVDPVGIRSPFQEGMRYAEALTATYHRHFKIQAKIIRLFNAYGPRLRLNDGRMIPEFFQSALNNTPITVYGDKDDKTTFCFITDTIEGILRMMQSHELGPMNIGNPEEHTIETVAKKIIELSGSRPDIRVEPARDFDSQQGTPSIRQARENLGWFPVVPLDEGLRRTLDFMRGTRKVGMESLGYGQESKEK